MSSRIPSSPDFSSRSHEAPSYTAEQTQVIEAVDSALTIAQSITAQIHGRYTTRLNTNRVLFSDESRTQTAASEEPAPKRRRVFTSEPMQSLSIRPSTPPPVATTDCPSTPPTVAERPSPPQHPFSYRPPETIQHPFMRNNLNWIDRPGPFSIDWEGQRINLTKLHTGQFFIVSEIANNQPQLIPNIPNEHLIVKMFDRHNLLVTNAPAHKVNEKTIDAMINQYHELRDLNLAVATIHNIENITNGNCGYFLFERIPHPFVLPWTEGQDIDSLKPEARNLLDQLKHFFKTTYDNNCIIEDLCPNYFRLRDNNLVLVDVQKFHSDIENQEDMNYRFYDMLTQFGCNRGDEIYNYLNPVPIPQ